MSRPTASPTRTGEAARNGSKPAAVPVTLVAARPRSRRSQATVSDRPTIRVSNTSRRGDRRKTGGSSRSRSRRARRATGQVAATRRSGRAGGHHEHAERRTARSPGPGPRRPPRPSPTSAAGTVIRRPSQSCAASSCPAEAPRAASERQGGSSSTDDEHADQADGAGGHRQRTERGDRQRGRAGRPLAEVALDDVEQPGPGDRRARPDRAGGRVARLEPGQVRDQTIQVTGIEPGRIDEHAPAVAAGQAELQQVAVGVGGEQPGRVRDRVVVRAADRSRLEAVVVEPERVVAGRGR